MPVCELSWPRNFNPQSQSDQAALLQGNSGGMNFFWSEDEIDARLSRLIREGYRRARSFAEEHKIPTRIAALCVGIARIDRTMRLRGLYA